MPVDSQNWREYLTVSDTCYFYTELFYKDISTKNVISIIYEQSLLCVNLNKTTTILTISAVVAAAALVIGTFAITVASPAFAQSSTTTVKQRNSQSQTLSGFSGPATQTASNTCC